MEVEDDNVILFEKTYHRQSFLRKKVSLTIPICALLIVVFLSSIFIVSIISFYWINGTGCSTNNSEKIPLKPIYNSRPKRSPISKKTNVPCLNASCCTTPLDPNTPWTQNRLPKNIYPVDYQLTLELFHLNDAVDEYNGTINIVIEVQSPTNDIILNGDVIYSDFVVTDHSDPSILLNVDCVIIYPQTQTITIHLIEPLEVGNTYDVRISFFRALNIHGTGLFENQFNQDQSGSETSRIILTHFEPVHAREAFPCFDEPGFKSNFELVVLHNNNTQALSNWDEEESFWNGNSIQTEFQTVPFIPTALIAFSIFYTNDFDKKTAVVKHPVTDRNININLWARNIFFTHENGIYVNAPLDMIQRILTALLNIFQGMTNPIVPNKIDILAIPEYPSDAVSHWGFIICTELSLLYNPYTTSEIEEQRIALLIAKELAEQWYGNLVSFQWWTDLWLQQAISNYLKYHAVNAAYPQWNIHDQFPVTELLPTMFEDSMSTSHPIIKSVNSATEIEQLFDSIETIKSTAILRMADYYTEKTMGTQNNTLNNIVSFLYNNEYGFLIPDDILGAYQIGTWNSLDFFDRWLLQSNFPKISAQFIFNTFDNTYTFQLEQNRFLSTHTYDIDLYPPSTTPFDYIWYVPIICRFSNSLTEFELTQTFFLDRQIMNTSFGTVYYEYFYCNTDFSGYYIMDYTDENWQDLSDALMNNNTELIEIDRANLLNNAFLTAQSTDESYSVVREITQFLFRDPYTGLLSWQTLSYHVNRMLDVLEYESLYGVVQRYFRLVVRNYYQTYETTLWNDNGTFSEQILKGVIIQLACRLQLQECIEKVTSLWYEAYPTLDGGSANHSVVAHAREVVYRTHFQNSYNDSEWITIESDYFNFVDVQERYHLLEALTQSHQPWHLYSLLYRDAEQNKDVNVDLLQVLTLLAKNFVGRELAWLYYRQNWSQLLSEYGGTNQRLGQLLIDITATFEDQFHEYELIDFLVSTPNADANGDARYWALERANMNLQWIINSSTDMTNSFDLEP